MSTRTAKAIAWPLWALTLGVATAATAMTFVNPHGTEDFIFAPVVIIGSMSFATAGALIVSRHPGQPVGWLLCTLGFELAFLTSAEEYVTRSLSTLNRLPATTALAWLNGWLSIVALAAIPMVFLLFPTGRVPSRRWRPLVWVMVLATALAVVSFILLPTDLARNYLHSAGQLLNPTGVEALDGIADLAALIGGLALLASALLSVAALIIRFRRARGEERQQLRWLAYVAATAAVAFIASAVTEFSSEEFRHATFLDEVLFTTFVLSLALGIPLACGIAILKYRLYALDIVIKKTVVFAVLAAFLSLVYVAVVVGIGAVVTGTENTVLTFAATAIVAIAFQPLRALARRLADRVVYGKRATPYEVLSEFSDQVATGYSTEEVLPRMAQILGEGIGARKAGVWLRVGSEVRLLASWPHVEGEVAGTEPIAAVENGALPGGDRTFPVRHQGELLGALTVDMPPAEPITPSQAKLASDLASQAGLVLRNVRLIEEVRASRQRLVAAQDEERRRIERNLHDGAQQQLVALAVKLGLARTVNQQDHDRANHMLEVLQSDAQGALENLRDLARGIYPPLLADQGLAAAVAAQARKAPFPVEVETDGLGRYAQEAEAAVYFCCLEAMQNVAKYAEASSVRVKLGIEDGELTFEVSDDGKGFDPERTPTGAGLQNMADRLAALGGSIEVRSQPGQGTTVFGRVPVRAVQPAT
jgi:signal transduction histidine kinase